MRLVRMGHRLLCCCGSVKDVIVKIAKLRTIYRSIVFADGAKFFRHVYKAFPKNKLRNSIGKAKAIPNESLQQMDSYLIGMA